MQRLDRTPIDVYRHPWCLTQQLLPVGILLSVVEVYQRIVHLEVDAMAGKMLMKSKITLMLFHFPFLSDDVMCPAEVLRITVEVNIPPCRSTG